MIKLDRYKDWVSLTEARKAYGANFHSKQTADVALRCGEGKNEVIATISTDSIDRSGEIVIPKGVDLSDFKKQPSIFLQHDTDALPLGPCLWIKANDNAIVAKYRVVTEASDLHKAVWELIKSGAYRSHSIGFLSYDDAPPSSQELRFHPEWKGASAIHRSTKLLEFSLVSIPCNTDAVAMEVSKGFSAETREILLGIEGTKAKETEQIKNDATVAAHAATDAIIKAARGMQIRVGFDKTLAALGRK